MVIGVVSSPGVNCFSISVISSKYIRLKRCAISDREFKHELFNSYGFGEQVYYDRVYCNTCIESVERCA